MRTTFTEVWCWRGLRTSETWLWEDDEVNSDVNLATGKANDTGVRDVSHTLCLQISCLQSHCLACTVLASGRVLHPLDATREMLWGSRRCSSGNVKIAWLPKSCKINGRLAVCRYFICLNPCKSRKPATRLGEVPFANKVSYRGSGG